MSVNTSEYCFADVPRIPNTKKPSFSSSFYWYTSHLGLWLPSKNWTQQADTTLFSFSRDSHPSSWKNSMNKKSQSQHTHWRMSVIYLGDSAEMGLCSLTGHFRGWGIYHVLAPIQKAVFLDTSHHQEISVSTTDYCNVLGFTAIMNKTWLIWAIKRNYNKNHNLLY